jgi:nucleolar complex protein 3
MKKLKELRTMFTIPDVAKSNLLKKLIIVSLTEIFKDIIPGYKIRIWSEKENEQQVWK